MDKKRKYIVPKILKCKYVIGENEPQQTRTIGTGTTALLAEIHTTTQMKLLNFNLIYASYNCF